MAEKHKAVTIIVNTRMLPIINVPLIAPSCYVLRSLTHNVTRMYRALGIRSSLLYSTVLIIKLEWGTSRCLTPSTFFLNDSSWPKTFRCIIVETELFFIIFFKMATVKDCGRFFSSVLGLYFGLQYLSLLSHLFFEDKSLVGSEISHNCWI